MFMCQKTNETVWFIWIGVSSLEQMRLLDHVNTKQCCEIQWKALEFNEEHKWLCDSLKFEAKQEKHVVQRNNQDGFSIYTSPLFTMNLL